MRRILVLFLLGALAVAAGYKGLLLGTPFPALTVRGGEVVNLELEAKNLGEPPATLRLKVLDLPPGWRAAFLGQGRIVGAVYLPPDEARRLTLRIEVPQGVEAGRYAIRVLAEGDTARLELPITLTVGEVLPPSLRFEAELPVLKGTPTTSFRYRATLKNESDRDLLVSLDADAPQGFEVVFKPSFSGQEVTSLPVKAGETKNLDIEVRPPPKVPAGSYAIQVHARAGEAKADLQLRAEITGRPELSITGVNGRLSGRAYTGRASPLKVVVKNRGSATAKNIELSAFAPSGWEVTFDPKAIEALPVGEKAEVTAKIRPSAKAIAGDYMVTITAKPKNGTSESADFRITVFTSTVWGVVGVGLIALALGALVLAMWRFGRR